MTSERNPRDTVVGTVGDDLSIEREGERYAIIRFQLTTFGTPVEIDVEYSWRPVQTETPEIKAGMVVRVRGWLEGDEMMMESWEIAEERKVSVLVCGGRKFSGWPAMQQTLDRIRPDVIIHGAAAGADSMAGRYARENDIECREFPAEWERYGRSAGYRRNQQMLDEGKTRPGGGIPRRAGHPEHGEDQPAAGLRGQHHRPPRKSQARRSRGKGIETTSPNTPDLTAGHEGETTMPDYDSEEIIHLHLGHAKQHDRRAEASPGRARNIRPQPRRARAGRGIQ